MPQNEIDFLVSTLADNDAIATLQGVAVSGALTLDGVLVETLSSWNAASGTDEVQSVGVIPTPSKVTLTSAENNSGVTWVITGYDERGIAREYSQIETISGLNNNTITTTKYWSGVYSIVGLTPYTGVKAGTSGDFRSATIPVDHYRRDTSISTSPDVDADSALSYTIEYTLDDVQDSTVTPTWFAKLSDSQIDYHNVITGPITALRFTASFTTVLETPDPGGLYVNILQQSIDRD